MSIAETERFVADLESNSVLRAGAKKSVADALPNAALVASVAFAASKGYSCSADQIRETAKAAATTSGNVLVDAELDAVAGGVKVIAEAPAQPMGNLYERFANGLVRSSD